MLIDVVETKIVEGKYAEARNLIAKELSENTALDDSLKADYLYLFFIASNRNYFEFTEPKNYQFLEKAIEIAPEYETIYEFYKNMAKVPFFASMFSILAMTHVEVIKPIFHHLYFLNDEPFSVDFDSEFYDSILNYVFLEGSRSPLKAGISIDRIFVLLNILYLKTKNDGLREVLEYINEKSSELGSFRTDIKILDSFDEAKELFISLVRGEEFVFCIQDNILTSYRGSDTDVVIPEGVEVLADNAFKYPENIKNVILPSTFKEGGYSLSNLINLEEISVSGDNPYYTSINNILYNKKMTRILYMPLALRGNIVIEEGIEKLSYIASKYITGLRLPDTLVEIDSDALKELSNLESIYIGPKLQYLSFKGLNKLRSIKIHPQNPYYKGDKGLLIYNESNIARSFSSKMNENPKYTTIMDYAYSNISVTELSVSDAITEICPFAFTGMPNLKTLILPEHFRGLELEFIDNIPDTVEIKYRSDVISKEDYYFAFLNQF